MPIGSGVGFEIVINVGFNVARNRQYAEPFYRTVLKLGTQGEIFNLDFFVYDARIHFDGNDAVFDFNSLNIIAFDIGGDGCHSTAELFISRHSPRVREDKVTDNA